jgi:large subunit ribosomal protein L29
MSFSYPRKKLLIMKISEIKELSVAEIDKKLRELGEELLQLQIRKQTGQVEKPHLIKEIRRNRARLFTQLQTLQQQAS